MWTVGRTLAFWPNGFFLNVFIYTVCVIKQKMGLASHANHTKLKSCCASSIVTNVVSFFFCLPWDYCKWKKIFSLIYSSWNNHQFVKLYIKLKLKFNKNIPLLHKQLLLSTQSKRLPSSNLSFLIWCAKCSVLRIAFWQRCFSLDSVVRELWSKQSVVIFPLPGRESCFHLGLLSASGSCLWGCTGWAAEGLAGQFLPH